ncbi:MAG: NB-ARC domain-containing protein [Pleurocapsa sp.]
MSKLKQKRRRGVIITPQGLEKLRQARTQLEYRENYGDRFTYEKLSELTNLDINTIKKILVGKERVDKRSLERFFQAFKLKLTEECYFAHQNSHIRHDWREAIAVDYFFGRNCELDILEHWLLKDGCRLVVLLGMGGIGKTTLSIKLAERIKGQFDCMIWKSLRDTPPVAEILANLIEFLSQGKETEASLPERLGDRITRLIDYLRSMRCLIFLDNAESLLDQGVRAGKYRQGYEGYGELFKRLGESNHNSCFILTSREKPKEVATLEGQRLAVRSLQLEGLKTEGQEIFKVKGLSGSELELKTLSDRYVGNPLALKVVATTILDLFEGNIAAFLRQEMTIFGDIRDILDQQFQRLSSIERKIMYWLAIAREPISLTELREDFVLQVSPIKLLEALESLSRRSLIEKNASQFTQQPVVMEYVTNRVIEIVCEEIASQQPVLFRDHALIKATAKDYLRDNQIRLILQPIIKELLAVFNSKEDLEVHLRQILATIQERSPLKKCYTAGNIINLFCQMETDLTGYDFSNLCVWQADLCQKQLHDVNFRNSDLSKSVFAENFGGIWSVAFSPDGQYLAAGDTKGNIILRQVQDGQIIRRFQGHNGWVVSLAFSPDGHTLASGSCDCTAKLWDVNNAECLHSLDEHEQEVWSVAFSPDGETLASGCDDSKARLWNVSTGECIKLFQGHKNEVLAVTFSLDGHQLFSGSQDSSIRFWDIETGNCQQVLQGHQDGVRSISLSPDGQTLVSSSNDRTLRLWNIATGECLKVFQGHKNVIFSVTFSPQGNLLASGSIGQKVRLWDLATGECLKVFRHSNMVNSVAFHPQGDVLASGSYDQSVKLWNVKTYQCVKTWHGYSNQALSVTFSPDGQTLVSGGHDQKLRLWELKTGKIVKTLHEHTNWILSVAMSPQHNLLASGSRDKTIKLWALKTGKILNTFIGHEAAVRSVAFIPDTQILASGSEDCTIRLWNINSARSLKTLQGHQAEVWSIALNYEGQMLASASFDQTVKLWNVNSGECLKTLKGHDSWVWSIAFSPDNKTLVSTSADQTIRIWDINTGKCQRILRDEMGHSQLIAFSKDGQAIVSYDQDHNIKLWNINNGECIKTLHGHKALINSIAFSPDGSTLVSSSEDETIKLWDVNSGKCLKTLKPKNPYEGMNIQGVTGLSKPALETLKLLGANSGLSTLNVKRGSP